MNQLSIGHEGFGSRTPQESSLLFGDVHSEAFWLGKRWTVEREPTKEPAKPTKPTKPAKPTKPTQPNEPILGKDPEPLRLADFFFSMKLFSALLGFQN